MKRREPGTGRQNVGEPLVLNVSTSTRGPCSALPLPSRVTGRQSPPGERAGERAGGAREAPGAARDLPQPVRIASVGERRAACAAGASPATAPVTNAAANPPAQAPAGTT